MPLLNLLPTAVTSNHRLQKATLVTGNLVRSGLYRMGVAVQRFQDLPRETRVPLFLSLVPLVCAGGASGAYYLRLHQVSETMTTDGMPRLAPLDASRRLLVISPHCDDETLGAGGLIADARRAGMQVEIVFITNGDGFPVAASRELRQVKPSPSDLIRFAVKRQQEALQAAQALGVPDKDVVFLGYPDQGLKPMWETNWSARTPFRSPFTRQTASPYARCFAQKTPYAGEAVVSDLGNVLKQFQPTDILVTHPSDDHPDHSTAAAFTQAALFNRQDAGDRWAQDAKLHYYLVHRGDWPLPQGYYPNRPLTPPPAMLRADTQWNVWGLSKEAQDAKRAALGEYKSQTSICGRFLNSFVRTTELVGNLPPQDSLTSDATSAVALGPVAPFESQTAKDATGDNVMRYADAAADLTGLDVSRDAHFLKVRVRARGAISGRVRYQLRLRMAADQAQNSTYLNLDVPSKPASDNSHVAEITIPLNNLDGTLSKTQQPVTTRVWVSAETRWKAADVPTPVDCTGYRPFDINL